MFLYELSRRLQALNIAEVDTIIAFYAESIDDRIDGGLTEEQAVAELGNMDNIVNEILSDMPQNAPPMQNNTSENAQKSSNKTLWIVLAILGFPLWGPVLIAVTAVIFSLFVALWSLVLSLCLVPVILAFTGVALFVAGIFLFGINAYTAFALLAAALILIGIALMLISLMVLAIKGAAALTKLSANGIKGAFVKKSADNNQNN